MSVTPEWRTWRPAQAPFPFATAIHGEGFCLVTEGGHDPTTGEIPSDAATQTRLALEKAADRLTDAGMTLAEVIYVRPYATSRQHAAEMDAVLADRLPDPKPACGALVICELAEPEMKIELELLARRGAVLVGDEA